MKEKQLKCIVVDDEKHARDLLKHYIDNDERLVFEASFQTISELSNSNKINQIDILFLDVEMPGKSGIDFLKETNLLTKVVLTTAYKDYAFESYDLDVFDYLLKPILENRFQNCVNKICLALDLELKAEKYTTIENNNNEYLLLKSGYSEVKIWLKDILYISAESEYVCYHTTTQKHLIYLRLKKVEEQLSPPDFIRVHRSFIIAKQFITTIKKDKVILKNGIEIPVSKPNKYKLNGLFE